jgi:hypothetical protein
VDTGERASSKDSIRNEVLHSRRSRHSHSRGHAPHGENTPDHGRGSAARRRPSVDQHGDEFERVEEVVCPNCPLHGRHSSVPPGEANHTHGPGPVSEGSSAAPSAAEPSGQSSPKVATDQVEASDDTLKTPVASTQATEVPDNAEAANLERTTSQGYNSSTETTLTVSTPGRSPATPSFFDPLTPKAMVFSFEDDLPDEPTNEDPAKQPDSEESKPVTSTSPSMVTT